VVDPLPIVGSAGGSAGKAAGHERGWPRATVDQRAEIERVAEVGERLLGAIETVIDGKAAVIRTALVVLFSEGHLLIEDVPGVGKTMLAKALAAAMSGTVRRIQFTPDLLPSDVTGVSVYEPERHTFEFRPGAVFANVVIGDEINRASPKTQSALLECMEERQVTVDGHTYPMAPPFFVVATQNPVEMEGTYPLPEAQRDRFTAQVAMGYPSGAAELAMLDNHTSGAPLEELKPVTTAEEIATLTAAVRGVHVAEEVRRYVVDLVTATRRHPELRLGASPRAGLQLLRTARAAAALEGRAYVLPDDVQALAGAVLSHRLLLTPEAAVSHRQPFDIVAELVSRVPLPEPGARRRGF
jgi:MoxR-like ATPase